MGIGAWLLKRHNQLRMTLSAIQDRGPPLRLQQRVSSVLGRPSIGRRRLAYRTSVASQETNGLCAGTLTILTVPNICSPVWLTTPRPHVTSGASWLFHALQPQAALGGSRPRTPTVVALSA